MRSASAKAATKEELEAQIFEASKITEKSMLAKEDEVFFQKSPEVRQKVDMNCSLCNELLPFSNSSSHQISCPFRSITCPNFGVGCNESSIPLNRIQFHLEEECFAEKLKQEMICRSLNRNKLVQCSTCGYQVELRLWKRHERELCENRLVPCKNSHLGCSTLVPLNERHLHESIDESYERCCIYFSGHGSFMKIEESDIVPPWSAEVSSSYLGIITTFFSLLAALLVLDLPTFASGVSLISPFPVGI